MARGEIAERFTGPFGETVTRYQDGHYTGMKCDWYAPDPLNYRCEVKHTKYPRCKKCKIKGSYYSTKEKNSVIKKGR